MRVDLRFCAYVEAAKEMVSLDEGIHWLENNPILFWIRGAGFCGNRRCIYIFFYIFYTRFSSLLFARALTSQARRRIRKKGVP
jgi:hypothetical protein